MSCTACLDFAANPRTGSYHATCLECKARSIAQSPAFFDALEDMRLGGNGFPPTYKLALQRAFGGAWKEMHIRVKHYAGLVKAGRA